ncbi:MAG: aminopeptidase, partial [Nonlabens sp.]|nr:aminopeptidase [Nonlabens sp.]
MRILFLILLFCSSLSYAQHKSKIIATLNSEVQSLTISQEIEIHNTSNSVWNEIYMLDWANAFSSTDTPLADRFADDFKNKFEFTSDENRGRTTFAPETLTQDSFKITRLADQQDIIRVNLSSPLRPSEKRTLAFHYTVDIAEDDFTGYGRSSINDYNLRYWYLSPAVFKDGAWSYHSHKNLHDFYAAPMDFSLSLHVPPSYKVISNLTTTISGENQQRNSYLLEGNLLKEARLHITQQIGDFSKYSTPAVDVLTDINDTDLPLELKLVFTDRIASFLQDKLGAYPQKTMLVSERFYRENPVYGLSSLPKFINPFPAGYTHEVKLLKAMTRNWVSTLSNADPRNEGWLQDATIIYLLIQYQEMYYPDLKISGKLGEIWGIRGFYASQLKFNDQYNLLYLNSARQNLDQAINTPIDSLVKYNQQLGTPYKAGLGLRYLNDYLGDASLEKSLRDFYNANNKSNTTALDLQNLLEKNTTKDVSWFFDDYITSHKYMEWKIKSVAKRNDSVHLVIKNKSDRRLPVAIYLLENDSIVHKQWIDGFLDEVAITLPRKRATQVALN